MLVISYSDFFNNPSQYQDAAKTIGIKILPNKKLSSKIQKKLDALKAVAGIFPSDLDENQLHMERINNK